VGWWEILGRAGGILSHSWLWDGSVKPTGGGGRTHTPLRETDFESVASASSATPAKVVPIIVYGAGS
jgi:hypothetical protein